MKKVLMTITDALENFWFTFLLLTIAGLLALRIPPVVEFTDFAKSGAAAHLGLFLWRICLYFIFPVGAVSIVFIIRKKLSEKNLGTINFWLPIFYILITITLFFIIISHLNTLQYQIDNILLPYSPRVMPM